MSETTELLPCPFCGGEAKLGEDELAGWVDCPTCGACIIDDHNDPTIAAQLWNRRASTHDSEREALCDELIERAADEKRQLKLTCHLCGGVGAWNIDKGFYGHRHEPGCLHLRARALRGDGE